MKQKEQLEKLFKAAREEETHFSYEKLAQQFKQQTSIASTIQQLLSKIIHMNTLLIILAGGVIGFLWYSSPTPPEDASKFANAPIKESIAVEVTNSAVFKIEEQATQHSALSLTPQLSQKTSLPQVSFEEKPAILISSTDSLVSVFDTSLRTNLSTTLKLKSDSFLNSIHPENEFISQPIKQAIIFHQLVTINRQDAPKQILKTKQAIADMGFEVKKFHTNRKKGEIEKILLHLTHSEGLDWKFTVTHFNKIEFKIIKDDKVGLRAFAYRFNEKGDFSPLVYLTEKSVGKHKVASGTKGRHINRRKKQE